MINYAAAFGNTADKGMRGTPIAFPFIYNLINSSQDLWEQVKNPALLDNLTGIGPVVPAGGHVVVPVLLDADYNFKLLYIRYTVHKLFSSPNGPIFVWHEPFTGVFDPADNWNEPHTELTRHVRVNVWFQTNSQALYGAPWNTQTPPQPNSANRDPLPVVVASLQGNEYAIEPARLPMLLPAAGAIMYDIYNDFDVDVVVGATAHGMKVRL